MGSAEKIKEKLDSAGITEPSKLYTPFTMFTVFFVLYFNAELFGSIFLAEEWKIKLEALKLLGNRTFPEWFWSVFAIFGSALLMTFAYGLCQAISALIWGAASRANTELSRLSNKGGYIAFSEHELLRKKVDTLSLNERKLYDRLNSYHDWSPDDIERLGKEVKEHESRKIKVEGELSESKSENSQLNTDNKELVYRSSDLEKQLGYKSKIIDFHRGYITASQYFSNSGFKISYVDSLPAGKLIDSSEACLELGLQDILLSKEHRVSTFFLSIDSLNEIYGKYVRFIEYFNLASVKFLVLDNAHVEGKVVYLEFHASKDNIEFIESVKKEVGQNKYYMGIHSKTEGSSMSEEMS